jgi:hypothetical protein
MHACKQAQSLKEFLLPMNTQQLCSGDDDDDDDGRIRSCLSQLHQSDITSDERQELDEALHREVGDHLILGLAWLGLAFALLCFACLCL